MSVFFDTHCFIAIPFNLHTQVPNTKRLQPIADAVHRVMMPIALGRRHKLRSQSALNFAWVSDNFRSLAREGGGDQSKTWTPHFLHIKACAYHNRHCATQLTVRNPNVTCSSCAATNQNTSFRERLLFQTRATASSFFGTQKYPSGQKFAFFAVIMTPRAP